MNETQVQLEEAAAVFTGHCARAVRQALARPDATGVLNGLLTGQLALIVARDQVSITAVSELPPSAGITNAN